jgi:O-antigen/teichoic acid export membrane protein
MDKRFHEAQQGAMMRLAPGREISRSRVLFWAKKGGYAVLDQGFFSGANFIVNILLARWLEPAQYGAFVLAYAMFLFLGAIHTAVLTEPMTIFGAGKYAENFRDYLGILIYSHCGVTGLIALVLAVAALVCWGLGAAAMALVLVGLVLASPAILLLWLVRRAFYVALHPEWSAVGGMLYGLLMVAGLYGLSRQQWLSSTAALLVMGGSSLVVSLGFLGLLQPAWRLERGDIDVGMVLHDHWSYGRWAVSSEALLALHGHVYTVIVTALLGFTSLAGVRAIQNLVTPVGQLTNALTLLIIPNSSRYLGKSNSAALLNSAMRVSAVLGLPTLAYWVIGVFAGRTIVNVVYGGKYDGYAELFSYLAFVPVLTALRIGPNVIHKATRRSDLVLITHISSLSISVLVTWISISLMHVLGAVVAINISTLTGVITAWYLLCKKTKLS